jgi:hypothetical protein
MKTLLMQQNNFFQVEIWWKLANLKNNHSYSKGCKVPLLWSMAIHHMHTWVLQMSLKLDQVWAKILCPNHTPMHSLLCTGQANKEHKWCASILSVNRRRRLFLFWEMAEFLLNHKFLIFWKKNHQVTKISPKKHQSQTYEAIIAFKCQFTKENSSKQFKASILTIS